MIGKHRDDLAIPNFCQDKNAEVNVRKVLFCKYFLAMHPYKLGSEIEEYLYLVD